MYRSPVETKKPVVRVTNSIELIAQVETARERFGFRATVTLVWKITKEDAVGHGAATALPPAPRDIFAPPR